MERERERERDGEKEDCVEGDRRQGQSAGDVLEAAERIDEESSRAVSALRCRDRSLRLLRPRQALRVLLRRQVTKKDCSLSLSFSRFGGLCHNDLALSLFSIFILSSLGMFGAMFIAKIFCFVFVEKPEASNFLRSSIQILVQGGGPEFFHLAITFFSCKIEICLKKK